MANDKKHHFQNVAIFLKMTIRADVSYSISTNQRDMRVLEALSTMFSQTIKIDLKNDLEKQMFEMGMSVSKYLKDILDIGGNNDRYCIHINRLTIAFRDLYEGTRR